MNEVLNIFKSWRLVLTTAEAQRLSEYIDKVEERHKTVEAQMYYVRKYVDEELGILLSTNQTKNLLEL